MALRLADLIPFVTELDPKHGFWPTIPQNEEHKVCCRQTSLPPTHQILTEVLGLVNKSASGQVKVSGVMRGDTTR